MSEFDAIGNSRRFNSVRRGRNSGAGAHETDGQLRAERSTEEQIQQLVSPTKNTERAPYARLNFNRETKEVVLEILNPQTGNLLTKVSGKDLSLDMIHGLIDAARANTKTRP